MHPSILPSTKSVLLHLDGTKVVERAIGIGGTGIVIERKQYALKIPRITRPIEVDGLPVATGRLTPEEGHYDERPDLIRSFQDEKAIYRRLGDHPGIVRCFNASSDDSSIQMDLMKNGDLRHFLAQNRPEKSMQLSWFSDFGESMMMPLDWDLNGSDEFGFSIATDIGQFGAVMFEIVTGEKCNFDLAQGQRGPGNIYTWPRQDSFPSTTNTWLGHIIERCWTRGITSTKQLAADLDKEKMNGVE